MSAQGRRPRLRKLSDEERALWEAIARSVAPLRRKRLPADAPFAAALTPKPNRASPVLPVARATVSAGTAEPSLDRLDRRLRQRLARGTASIDARIDLHGRTQREAHAALLRFLRRVQGEGARFVLVITGKGASGRTEEPGVLKRQVPLWLRLPEFRPYVIGFETAHSSHGGEGALYVRLRRAIGRLRTR